MVPSPDPLIAYLAENDAPCPGCGYNLRGLASDVCPECGHAFILSEIRPEPQKPEDITLPLHPVFLLIAIPVISIGFLPLVADACWIIWDLFVLNDKTDVPVSVALACVVSVGVVYAFKLRGARKKGDRFRTRASVERAQNIRIALVLIAFAVAIVLIFHMPLETIGRILEGWAW